MGVLAGKIVIITGASSGIGEAAALMFAREGATLVLGARRKSALESLASRIGALGGTAACLAGDVRDEAYAAGLVALALERFGRLDVAFNNAGTLGPMGPTPGIALTDWNDTMAVNLSGAFLAAKHQIPAMVRQGSGSVIFTSTFVGHTTGFPGVAAYAASKAGIVGLTQALATEFGAQNVRVNALLPGGTAQPEEIARVALFLASEGASFVTGSALLADGGISVYRA